MPVGMHCTTGEDTIRSYGDNKPAADAGQCVPGSDAVEYIAAGSADRLQWTGCVLQDQVQEVVRQVADLWCLIMHCSRPLVR